ncbi:unnamed protein product [Didymodactylos carnosus]|uniref:Notch n=1 Tax=Didymodactylos carnosus TaxID=1234261 RepID=A0A813YWZ1_9BILA|nr:unnamed protein product [Didymodactylos carnosus]CAF0889900.1 unnamed protein product [Didymodactylos carnosus]CAF3545911.1 unnamed protein product [Didymodactylos carnosus]CAF3674420.1 unnamed protein product [Didymodactylos carnosus]
MMLILRSNLFSIILLLIIIQFNPSTSQTCTPDMCNKHGTCLQSSTTIFACQCDAGFRGPTCNEEINECLSSPCANNGTCRDLENGFVCTCLPDFNGTLCNTPTNPCQSSPCGSGKCFPTNQPTIPYYCQCPNGENMVSKCPEPSPCTINPCGAGDCEVNPKFPNGYLCKCFDKSVNVQLTTCPQPKNPCVTMPCGKSATCVPLHLAPNGYICFCGGEPNAAFIDKCPIPSLLCDASSCKNGGTCLPFSPTEPWCNPAQVGSTCCPSGFTGTRCETAPVTSSGCTASSCGSGMCYQLSDTGAQFICICSDGTFGSTCANASANIGKNNFNSLTFPMHSTTTQTTAEYRNYPSYAKLIGCMPDSCKNGGTCVAASPGSTVTCRCKSGFTGAYCESAINECASNPCLYGGTCYDMENAYACFCPDKMFRPQCFPPTDKVSSGQTPSNSPVNNPQKSISDCMCQNGGICSVNSKTCLCLNGYTGTFCEYSSGSVGASCRQIVCQNGGTCQIAICICKPGYSGSSCESEYFRCRSNGRFADTSGCGQGKYFECVYVGQYDLGLPNGVLYSRSCPPGLRFNANFDRCDYPSAVQC